MLEFCEAAGIAACVVTLPVTETVADLVDLMEYSFGGNDTTYGALRIKDGRTKPYLPYVGNPLLSYQTILASPSLVTKPYLPSVGKPFLGSYRDEKVPVGIEMCSL